IWGDPHYVTFDGKRYDFQGVCEYTLVTDCLLPNSHSSYHLKGHNFKRNPSDNVSRLRHISLDYRNHTYTLGDNGDVLFDGVHVTPPLHIDDVYAVSSGVYTAIWTLFGLVVRWDGKHAVEIQLPYKYQNSTCGLCGNYNGDPEDDIAYTRNGSMAKDIVDFGNSWVVDSLVCDDSGVIIVDPCSSDSDTFEEAQDLCYALISSDTSLSSCRDYLNETAYYEACVYDMCASLPNEDLLCDSFEEYAQACRERGGEPGDWRQARCPFDCPEDRVYNPCGSICPVTCALVEFDDCPGACVETCECPSGTVLSGEHCVQLSQCGCFVDGIYYQPGDEWVESGCSSACVCEDGQVSCLPLTCGEFAECQIKNNVRGCYCIDGFQRDGHNCTRAPAFCRVWGDPHYITYDGLKYDFQGVCDYTLTRDCSSDYNNHFSITVTNFKRNPDDTVAFTRMLTILLGERIIELRGGDVVFVDGVRVNLPTILSPDAFMRYEGAFTVLRSSPGLVVRWDGTHSARVTVPPTLFNQTCGLCGNFDGNADNEFILPDGTEVENVDEFGDSWFVDGTCEGGTESPNPCQDYENVTQAENICKVILNRAGPFGECFEYVTPMPFYESCVYDACATLPDQGVICDDINDYAEACRDAGGQPEPWRHDGFCPFDCPAGSTYSICTSPCAATCADYQNTDGCDGTCVEACECNDGFVKENNECVPIDTCGCWSEDGEYYKANETRIAYNCSNECSCNPHESLDISCVILTCDVNAVCDIIDGVRNCYCTNGYQGDGRTCDEVLTTAQSTTIGDSTTIEDFTTIGAIETTFISTTLEDFTTWAPVETTFKSTTIDESTTYVPVETTFISTTTDESTTINEPTTDGSVETTFVSTTIDESATYVPVETTFLSTTIDESTTINGPTTDVPVETVFVSTTIDDPTSYSTVETTFLSTLIDESATIKESTTDVPVETTFSSTIIDEPTTIDEPTSYAPVETTFSSTTLIDESTAIRQSTSDVPVETTFLSTIIDESTPEDSTTQVDSRPTTAVKFGPTTHVYYTTYDSSTHLDYTTSIDSITQVDIMTDYASDSTTQQPTTRDQPTTAPPVCPLNSTYSRCGCQTYCPSELMSSNCTEETCEGVCVCDDGFALINNSCTPLEECPCVKNGQLYAPDSNFLSDDCTENCTCINGESQCSTHACHGSADCENDGQGQRICVCDPGYIGDGQLCTPTFTFSEFCTVWGDPHYLTPDGLRYDFQGACTYTLMESDLKAGDDLTSFHVYADNYREDEIDEWSYVKDLYVEFNNMVVELRQGSDVYVDGILVNLPVLEGDLYIARYGYYTILSTRFGLRIGWTGEHVAEIQISSLYFDKVRGLCGNVDGNITNDFQTPTGSLAPNSTIFGDSWVLGSSCSKETPLYDTCETIELQNAAVDVCSTYLNNTEIFGSCHQNISLDLYYTACILDACATNIDMDVLCDTIRQYALRCDIRTWREDLDVCVVNCSANAHFDSCASACQPSCANFSSDVCTEFPTSDCVEGCVCNEGFVSQNDTCVEPSECGCTWNGRYYEIGESVLNNDCTDNCTCTPSGETKCTDFNCPSLFVCGVMDGQIQCYEDTSTGGPTSNAPVTTAVQETTLMPNLTYTLDVSQLSSSAITITWTTSVAVNSVTARFRAEDDEPWHEDTTTIPGSRTMYQLSGIEPGSTYVMQLIFSYGAGLTTFSNELAATSCQRGFQGADECIDYQEIGAYDVILKNATSDTLMLSWEIDGTLQETLVWVMVQYRSRIESAQWQNSTTLETDVTSYRVEGLSPGQLYELRVLVLIDISSPASRRKRAIESGIGESFTVTYATCPNNFQGENCEEGKTTVTVVPPTTQGIGETTVTGMPSTSATQEIGETTVTIVSPTTREIDVTTITAVPPRTREIGETTVTGVPPTTREIDVTTVTVMPPTTQDIGKL
ncbi:IgGFc-binding protein-like, partial [Anneissia japonica]|uniref:IgGFc-binding protein-like n=1 Tax=Anneissia japonica TaxID=1529436 RepID=UPI0014258548